MERAAFLIEETGHRLSCLINPASVVVRRSAGIRPRRSLMGLAIGAQLADDPLLYTGGGRTELEVDLLFDVALAGSDPGTTDVRDLTHPLWVLSENLGQPGERGRPPAVRFVWGKAWNIPVIVADVAERFEEFAADGVPRRSWMRMRLLRHIEPPDGAQQPATPPPDALTGALDQVAPESLEAHEVIGSASGAGERLDELASRFYGNPGYWRRLAAFNNIDDPRQIAPGTVLRVPPANGGPR